MSPRPKKIRKCEGNFCGRAFKPTGTPLTRLEQIELFRDEMEALRLCDRDGLTQEEAGQKMEFHGEPFSVSSPLPEKKLLKLCLKARQLFLLMRIKDTRTDKHTVPACDQLNDVE